MAPDTGNLSMIKRCNFVYPLIAVAAAMIRLTAASDPILAQTPAASMPPLGTLLQEYEPVVMPEATAYALFTTDDRRPHQVWYRVVGGSALFQQRLRVYLENAAPRPPHQLPPEVNRWQELTPNTPTTWLALPAATGIFSYYFDGDHKSTPSASWQSGRGIRVKQVDFDNGSLYELGFEDQISLDDYNDLVVQVAVISQ